MKKILIATLATALFAQAKAQSVTYNHDSAKKNQVLVMETGGGSLTPELYYWSLHNSYRKSAAAKNKLGYRTTAGLEAYKQVEYAESIDSALTKRAEIEALNVADREIDLAWKVEGSKLNRMLDRFKGNIDRILLVGGSPDDKQRWEEYYNAYQCAVSATRSAYMPNAQRKREYLHIYGDVASQNETLVKYLVRLHSAAQTGNILSATNSRTLQKGTIASNAMGRWNETRQSVRNAQTDNGSDRNTGNDDGELEVER